jgi:preprotein translocase subunit SecB
MKDASLEMPKAPEIFLEQEPPKIDVQIHVDSQTVVEGISEVVVSATVTASINDKTLFLAEVKQAGIFQTANIPADQMELILGIACPSIVYPYLRANLADLIIRTGLPPVNLNEINFEAFYQQRKAQQDQPQPSLQ